MLYHEKMARDRRKDFRNMSRFIPGKNSTQCRSHHQKRIKKSGELYRAIARFYREKYI
jgi:hypothetical protein